MELSSFPAYRLFEDNKMSIFKKKEGVREVADVKFDKSSKLAAAVGKLQVMSVEGQVSLLKKAGLAPGKTQKRRNEQLVEAYFYG